MKQTIVNCGTGETTEFEISPTEISKGHKLELENAWRVFRSVRNSLLVASDWTQVADAPVDNLEWAGYRQALRDLPANTTDPTNPVWPTPPS